MLLGVSGRELGCHLVEALHDRGRLAGQKLITQVHNDMHSIFELDWGGD